MTAETDLLPLPKPQEECWIGHQLYSPDQMQAYARACVSSATEALRAEVERANSWNESVSVCRDHVADIVDGPCVICALHAAEGRAERLAEALRGLMLNSPGGHSCEEFHHYKSDRHMPGDDCPVQLRWNKAVTTAQAALEAILTGERNG